jgi:GDP-4-dehydro-6-deoxy-D-mannose reductase
LSLKAFITGATGFAGRHLMKIAQEKKLEIFGTAYPEKPSEAGDLPEGDFYHLDIRDAAGLLDLIEKIKPDWIFHLAAVSNVKHSWDKRKETLDTNLSGTFNLFEAVRKGTPKARLLYISSSDVYGVLPSRKNPLKENDTAHIMNPYAFTKVSGEMLCNFYSGIEGMNIIVARPFPHTGPGQTPDFVCSDWAFQVARIEKGRQKPIIRVGNLEIQRDFTDVRDVTRAYFELMEKAKSGEIYNVCSGRMLSLKEILDKLLSFSSESIEVRIDSRRLRRVDILHLGGDNSKIRGEVLWEPEIPFEQTLLDLLNYWRQEVR